ncbi:hypothetical protein HDF18_11055 [Mucilaginibacter sp. X5P1]|uniref:hypothetical protein n=1 Tax=Mucilaginibacter sp. X5P1 TaxID=2723088 RepID=UPI001610039F|nr:hypothetical protein [Mucilaginibacter sp. X5P1]MBB6140656.1 hypothetical protein [Mucilaginibacter sp. X5P1]
MKKATLFTLMLMGSIAVCIAAVNLNGNWKGLLVLNDGTEVPLNYKLKADGDKLTGDVETNTGDLPITDGKIKGDSIMFNVTYNGSSIPNKGKCYTDSIGMSITIGEDVYHVTTKKVTDK